MSAVLDRLRSVEPVGRLQSGLQAVLDAGGHWTERVGLAPVTPH